MLPPTIAGYQGADYPLTRTDLVRRNLAATEMIDSYLSTRHPKPRLRVRRGLWSCTVPVVVAPGMPARPPVGYGHNPGHAYAEWLRLVSIRREMQANRTHA